MVVGFVGCGGDKGPKANFVEGVVTLDGAPIEGVSVGFSPVAEKGVGAVGRTDAAGTFKLSAMQGGKSEAGAVAGEYYVTFQKTSTSTTSLTPDDPNYKKMAAVKSERPKVTYAVPQAYGAPTTSGFRVTVKEGKNSGDQFKFNLKSDFGGAKAGSP
jgi:hypothetical protein